MRTRGALVIMPPEHTNLDSAQHRLLETCASLLAISLERICGHSDIAPGRKTDPGPAFDWQRIRIALQQDKELT